jgi:N-acetylmuramoyl-L-alanine amidase
VRKINKIIIHCAATPEDKNFTVEDINRWHKERGFIKIGYHYVIYIDGSIHQGRELGEVGAHCTGYNRDSIGICYIGGVDKDGKTPKDTRTNAQKESLLKLLKELKTKFPQAEIYGHRDFSKKDCPSFDAKTEYENI